MQQILISGANRGIGLALTQHYLSQGKSVIATARSPKEAFALQSLTDETSRLRIEALDIANLQSISSFTKRLHKTPIDILINNAGSYGPRNCSLGHIDYAAWLKTIQVNTLGAIALSEQLLDSLRLSQQAPTIAFLSSKMGSMEDNSSGGGYIYRSSKAALNACIKSLSIDLAPRIRVLALHPGWVQTEMGGNNALLEVSESVTGLTEVIANPTHYQSGGFYGYDGADIPW